MATTLTEQMGAMSIIDSLRHQEMVVKEHLNLPARREDVARRIRDYYQSKNIEVADDLVDQGVRDYFSKRLAFEAPLPGPIAALVARIYISRTRWIKPVAAVAVALAVFSVATIKVFTYIDDGKTAEVQSSALASIADMQRIDDEWRKQMDSVAILTAALSKDPVPSAGRLLREVSDTLALMTQRDSAVVPGKVTAESRDADRMTIVTNQQRLTAERAGLQKSGDQIVKIRTLIEASSRLRSTFAAPLFLAAVNRSPQLDESSRAAVLAIEQADTAGVTPAVESVAKVVNLLDTVSRMDSYAGQSDSILRKFGAMGLSGADMTVVNALASSITTAIRQLDAKKTESLLSDMKQLQTFAETPLTLNVVDRTGTKSGVERTYNASAGKSWFLVVEAVNPAGQIVPVIVTSAESGKKRLADKFGVRISQAEFERVKADKQSDGHVDDRLMGQKPANALQLHFNQRTSEHPDMITEW